MEQNRKPGLDFSGRTSGVPKERRQLPDVPRFPRPGGKGVSGYPVKSTGRLRSNAVSQERRLSSKLDRFQLSCQKLLAVKQSSLVKTCNKIEKFKNSYNFGYSFNQFMHF